MKKLSLLICLSTIPFLFNSLYASNEKLHVFFIHGLQGDETTFCDIPKEVEDFFGAENIQTKSLTYETHSAVKGTDDFMHEIHNQIEDYFEKNKLSKDTPYSLVVHSQGGIVGMKYLSHCVNKTKAKNKSRSNCGTDKTPRNVQHFVSLGSPFWGSPNAKALVDNPFLMLLGKGAANQIRGLVTGSKEYTNLRRSLIRNDIANRKRQKLAKNNSKSKFKELDKKLKDNFAAKINFTSIGGDISDDLNLFSDFYAYILNLLVNSGQLEDDIVVPLSSAKPDFCYSVEDSRGRVERNCLLLNDEFYGVRYPHINFGGRNGMACMKTDSKEEHLPYQIILKTLNTYFEDLDRNNQIVKAINDLDDQFLDSAKFFMSEINFVMPIGMQRTVEIKKGYISIEADPSKIETAIVEDAKIAKLSGLSEINLSKGTAEKIKKNKRVGRLYSTFYHYGIFTDRNALNFRSNELVEQTEICYKINIPGFKEEKACVDVRNVQSSFIQLHLDPIKVAFNNKKARFLAEDEHLVLAAVPTTSAVETVKKIGSDRLNDANYSAKNIKLYSLDLKSTGKDRVIYSRVIAEKDVSEGLKEIANTCYLGKVGLIQNTHTGSLYQNYGDMKKLEQFSPGDLVRIQGSFKSKSSSDSENAVYNGSQRYFITANKKFYISKDKETDQIIHESYVSETVGWVNAADIDIVSKVDCEDWDQAK